MLEAGLQSRYKDADRGRWLHIPREADEGCIAAESRCTLPSPNATDATAKVTEEGSHMARIVRGALVQATWTGDKESMIQKHEERAHQAAKDGAQVILFQELFYGPYFCQVQDAQYYSYTELIPDGPTTKRMQDLAKQTGMVIVAPMYEEDSQASGIYYNTAAVIDADGTYLGKYRKTHIPHVKGFWEKFYFRPGNLGYPVFETAVGRVGVYICYDRHFPEGARALGLNGAEMVFIPSATSRGLSEYLWRIEQPSHAVANGYYVGTINRVGIEAEFGDDDFYGQSYFVDPRGQFVGDVGDAHDEELIVRTSIWTGSRRSATRGSSSGTGGRTRTTT
jgi:N-carbamoylputrescine amidase